MPLSNKTQLAITTLAAYDFGPNHVAPRWYRWYLRFQPDTPPPLFGASAGAWTFLAVLAGTILWIAVFLLGMFALKGAEVSTTEQWRSFGLSLLIVSLFGGIVGKLIAKAVKMTATHEAATLGLPAWEAFDSNWRPSAQLLRERSKPERFWLRSLSSGIGISTAGRDELSERCPKPYVTQSLQIGVVAFFVFAWFFPHKAGSYADGIAFMYMIVCTVGIYRSSKSRPVPANALGWQLTHGLMAGVCFAALGWTPIADFMSYREPKSTFVFFVICVAMHLTEAVWFEQQKSLAMRAERAETERQLAEMRLSALKAQIEPHFIFNTIAHLRRLITTSPASAERMADELSDFLRASLKSLRDEFTSVEADVKLVDAYLQIAAIRMGARLAIDIEVEPAVAKTRIPPLMLLTLVENAIQHGIEPKPEGGRIAVTASKIMRDGAATLCLSVADTGSGFGQSVSAGAGLGLANIRERLRSVYGDRAELKLSNAAAGGVIAELHIPIEEAV